MLGDPNTVRVSGDETAAVFRRTSDVDAESRPDDYRDKPVQEAYVWSNLTSGNASRALWLLLLPFMVINLAHWMRPPAEGRPRLIRFYGLLVRLAGLTLTVLLVAAACEVALDLTAWQCAGAGDCGDRSWLGFLSPHGAGAGGWWTQPGRRLALAALIPSALVALLWYLSRRTWNAYESAQPLPHQEHDREEVDLGEGEAPDAAAPKRGARPEDGPALGSPGFWYGRRIVARLRAAHTAAGLLTVAASIGSAVARYDREPGGTALLGVAGSVLEIAYVLAGCAVVWVVCGRGRSERSLDDRVDGFLVRLLPSASLVLLALTALYALWTRPDWRSSGPLPGDVAFGTITLVQGVLVVALAVTARLLYRTAPARRTVLRGLGGPAVAMLACALGGVMTGGVAQRVADWLDDGATPGQGSPAPVPGPPVILSWQASALPPLLVVVLLLVAWLALRTVRRTRAGMATVERDYPDERHDGTRTRSIAMTRAGAALTDRAPLVLGIISAVTLLLGAGALAGAWLSDEVPGVAAHGAPGIVQGAAQSAQALGSWLIGLGFVLFVAGGRRAYRDRSARRTIGILWDVGTFWPRAAHPFAPPCYAERAVPDLTWRMATWTSRTHGRLVISGHSQGSVLAAAAAWQLPTEARRRVALLTYGAPLERLYGRWFPAHFGGDCLSRLHGEIDCWRNLFRATDPIGGPVLLSGNCGPEVDHAPLKDPLAYGRTDKHPLPAPILGHSDYQADPAFAEERERLLDRLHPGAGVPRQPAPDSGAGPRPPSAGSGEEPGATTAGRRHGKSGRSSG
ncbi:hypothetical protein [Streptomyces tsukubensis]|nr:hypothetical protein [Streptomyces tsukubensis]